jgi:hypothetical protein
MIGASMFKGGVAVLILLLTLAMLDSYVDYSSNSITGAVTTGPGLGQTTTILTSLDFAELEGGWQSFGISYDMVGKKIRDIQGQCNLRRAWLSDALATLPGITKKSDDQTFWAYMLSTKNHVPPAVSADQVGFGVFAYTNKDETCSLGAKGYANSFGPLKRLSMGWNFISIPKSIVDNQHSFDDIKGTCSLRYVVPHVPSICATGHDQCISDIYLNLPLDEKMDEQFIGKGVWISSNYDCFLNENPGSVGSRIGIDLVPSIEIEGPDNIVEGDVLNIKLKTLNRGDTSTFDLVKDAAGSSYLIFLTIENADTGEVVERLTDIEDAVGRSVEPGEEEISIVHRWTATEGNFVIRARIDVDDEIIEDNDANNDKVFGIDAKEYKQGENEIVVGPPGAGPLPDLTVTGIEKVDYGPKFLCRTGTLEWATATVQNIGNADAVITEEGNRFFEVKISMVNNRGQEVCSGSFRTFTTIAAGEEEKFSALHGEECKILNSDYKVRVEVDSLGGVGVGTVEESDETNNIVEFSLSGTKECQDVGERENGCYCDLDKEPQTQKSPGGQCQSDFECKADFCVKGRCVSESQKAEILAALGY